MSVEFNRQVLRELTWRGRTATMASHSEASGRIELHGLSGDENTVVYYSRSAAGGGRVELLGISAAPHKRTGLYNVDRVVDRLLQHEKETHAAREERKKNREAREKHEKRKETAKQLSESLHGTNAKIEVPYWDSTDESFTLTISGMDAGQAAMLADFLQDNGYVTKKEE